MVVHGQPGFNFWLSVQGFGCPYLEQGKWGQVSQWRHGKIYGCPSDNHINIFGCPVTFLVVPGARTTKISNAAYTGYEFKKTLRVASERKVHGFEALLHVGKLSSFIEVLIKCNVHFLSHLSWKKNFPL